MRRTILLFLIYCTAAGAATVFRFVDENGVVTFSDTPPEGEVQVEMVEIDEVPPGDPESDRAQLEAMRETTDRMEASRMARERHRAELREIEARAEAYRTPPEPLYDRYTDYLPVYGGRNGYRWRPRPPWRSGFSPRPDHAVASPPFRPVPGSNDQLMRPLVSPRNAGAGSTNAQLMRPLVSSPTD